jgi:ectoine hydroxylase-related dioxygenase (phytanoyl-CoA dioxygenase family)
VTLDDFLQKGYAVIPDIFSANEISTLLESLDRADPSLYSARGDLYAIREVLQKLPQLQPLLFTPALNQIIQTFTSPQAFLTKSIYFDKPPGSNWFVAWHQDISITVRERKDIPGYSRWTRKSGITGVVPPIRILEQTLTVRIHLDDADETNGALRVVEGSHLEGIIRKESEPWDPARETLCNVPAGGIMLMRPLTMHASRRAQSEKRRRVIHMEFTDCSLNHPLEWGERFDFLHLAHKKTGPAPSVVTGAGTSREERATS